MNSASPSCDVVRDPRSEVRLTVAEVARMVGMSPRNIRAHQARRLLPPPVRHGREVYYHTEHIQRLDAIKALQRRGFNLAAVQAMLSSHGGDPDGDARLAEGLRRLAADDPHLVPALARKGAVVWTDEGALQVGQPRLLRTVLDLYAAGLGGRATVEVLDRVQAFADELARSTAVFLATPVRPGLPADDPSRPERDRQPDILAQVLASLLSESFWAAVERVGRGPLADP